MEILHEISLVVAIVGLAVILWGVLLCAVKFLAAEWRSLRGTDTLQQKEALRHQLGFYLLLGLEFLVAADVVHTVLTPNLQQLAVLGAIVAIRTVISFSINWELRQAGHTPAHEPVARAASSPPTA